MIRRTHTGVKKTYFEDLLIFNEILSKTHECSICKSRSTVIHKDYHQFLDFLEFFITKNGKKSIECIYIYSIGKEMLFEFKNNEIIDKHPKTSYLGVIETETMNRKDFNVNFTHEFENLNVIYDHLRKEFYFEDHNLFNILFNQSNYCPLCKVKHGKLRKHFDIFTSILYFSYNYNDDFYAYNPEGKILYKIFNDQLKIIKNVQYYGNLEDPTITIEQFKRYNE